MNTENTQALHFDDFDACAAALRPWSFEAVQLDRGPFTGQLIQAQSPTTLVTGMTFGRKLHQTGEPPTGMRTVGIPAHSNQTFFCRNQIISGNQVVLFPPGSELDAVSSPGFQVFSVSFPEERISEIACALSGCDYEELLMDRDIVDCSESQMRSLRRAAGTVIRPSDESDEVPPLAGSPDPDAGLDLMEVLVEALSHDEPKVPASPHRVRDLAVDRCLEYIEHHERVPISVVDLCRAARVSRRTLEYAFQERFGIPPKAYLLARRLNGVRSELKQPGRDRSVTYSANRWGFHHMSQLSALCRGQFGELPSETMN
jgi:AraC family ethanolamine operon transcriptional activator